MQIGLIGCGNMARALARGWARPLLCSDPLPDRAAALAAEVHGEALTDNAEVARRADLVVLCHKPPQLSDVAAEVAPHARAVASILAATTLSDLKHAYPDRPVYRFMPSLPVEVRQGAVVQAADPDGPDPQAADHDGLAGEEAPAGSDAPGGPEAPAGDVRASTDREVRASTDREVHDLFAELGTLVVLEERLVDVAMGLMSCGPAYVALVAEAQIDAGLRHGIPAPQGAQLVVQTLAGTAELLRRRENDTHAVRREVSSPGGVTAKGLDALERAGLRAAFSDALDAVLGKAT
ncbi:MAG TPA: pyrroline-5-carboxylate reductase [Solirubrobacteraceae bacterium]|nr:pyrroline-5-carboxylate reductase [Solirubrobacteraceae bacterium]